ncbi:hypothetical protein FACS1894166_12840 [Bacilli bacterium]|nr:hypothetical protein FACS1894166_12840 [Bacilli bacterium]
MTITNAAGVSQGCLAMGDITVATIPNNAFQNCTNLKSITTTGTLTSIGTNAFTNCTSLTPAGLIGMSVGAPLVQT